MTYQPAYTVANLQRLELAISEGVSSITFDTPNGQKRVVYRSLDDMLRIASSMRRALGIDTASPARYPSFDRGV